MIRHRRAYTDGRGRRVASGWVVASTDHPAAVPGGERLRRRFELDGGVLTLRLPAGVYLLHAELTGSDGLHWSQEDYLTLEDE